MLSWDYVAVVESASSVTSPHSVSRYGEMDCERLFTQGEPLVRKAYLLHGGESEVEEVIGFSHLTTSGAAAADALPCVQLSGGIYLPRVELTKFDIFPLSRSLSPTVLQPDGTCALLAFAHTIEAVGALRRFRFLEV